MLELQLRISFLCLMLSWRICRGWFKNKIKWIGKIHKVTIFFLRALFSWLVIEVTKVTIPAEVTVALSTSIVQFKNAPGEVTTVSPKNTKNFEMNSETPWKSDQKQSTKPLSQGNRTFQDVFLGVVKFSSGIIFSRRSHTSTTIGWPKK